MGIAGNKERRMMKNLDNVQLQTETPILIDQFIDIGEIPKAVKDLEKIRIERRTRDIDDGRVYVHTHIQTAEGLLKTNTHS